MSRWERLKTVVELEHVGLSADRYVGQAGNVVVRAWGRHATWTRGQPDEQRVSFTVDKQIPSESLTVNQVRARAADRDLRWKDTGAAAAVTPSVLERGCCACANLSLSRSRGSRDSQR